MHDGSAFLKFDYDDNTDSMKLYVEVAWFTETETNKSPLRYVQDLCVRS